MTKRPEYRFQLLGPVRAWRDETELAVGSPQQQAILAMLLLSRGGHVSLEAMIDALWGECPPKASTGAVRTYVSRIRQALAKGAAGQAGAGVEIDSTGDGYALRGERIVVDVDLFEARVAEANAAARQDGERAAGLCRQALAQWRGTPLAGVPGPYAEPVRARMVETRADAVEIESAALIASGDHLAAISTLRGLVADLPLRENLHELLMLALYRAGRRADALDVYGNVRRILREELGVEPGPSLRRMYQRLLGSEDGPVGQPAQSTQSAPPAQSTPVRRAPKTSRLPAPLTDFVGRGERLETLGRELGAEGAGHRVAVVSGMPGIGKTAFAVRAGHLLAESFPDGQMLLELGSTAGAPLPPAEILATLLHSVGLPAREIPDGLAARALAWREALAGRRMLVVLDDVDSVEQVRPALAAPAGCAFIVTGRRTLIGLDDAVYHEVGALEEAESLVLLERLIGPPRMAAEPEAARSLIAHCGGQPSALRSVGARLVSRPHWELASALEHLRETMPLYPFAGGAADGEAALVTACRSLTAEQALVFHAAAQFDDPWVQVGQAAVEFGMPESAVRDVFESLTDIHLLKPGKWGAYGFDPAVRSLARRLTVECRLGK
ncbi:MAG TPA: BTAD domain-containing putative transcriptional regulator [Actinospica sp.]|nr:BTAD domain-containing putative transcriptional regulator [Actinospica sp.]